MSNELEQNEETYTYEEVFEASLKYFSGDELAVKVFIDKYALRNKEGSFIESNPNQMHQRLAREFARIDSEKYGLNFEERLEIYQAALENFAKIVPQGSVISAVGNPYQQLSASNCVVVEKPNDSIDGIMQSGKELALLYKRRCGVGISIESLRPEGSSVNNAAQTTSGAWSFSDFYSYITRMIGQCLHEDTLILCKDGLKKIKDVKENDSAWTHKGWQTVLGKLSNKKYAYKLKTSKGLEIICSKDHVFHSINGEKPIKDFNIDESITQIVGAGWEGNDVFFKKGLKGRRNLIYKGVIFPTTLTPSLAYLIGHICANGELKKHSIELTSYHIRPQIVEKILTICKKEFDHDASLERTTGDELVYKKIVINSAPIIDFLEENHILGQESICRKVPDLLLGAKANVVKSFLSGVFDANGSIGRMSEVCGFTSTHKLFMQTVFTMLLAHGMACRFITRDSNTFSIVINSTENQALIRDFFSESLKFSDFLSLPNNSPSQNYLISDKVKEYTAMNKQEVFYDLILDDVHLFFANGLYAHNSGRRGACMVTMDVHHPDILKFITMKHDLTKVTGANVSVKLTNEFLKAVESNSEYEQSWDGKMKKMVSAKEVWDTIVNSAVDTAEPGILFWENILENLPAHCYEDFITQCVNPCSEISLSAYDACRLISINLTGYVVNAFEENCKFDFEAFASDVELSMHMLDNVIDLEIELIDKIISVSESVDERDMWGKLRSAASKGRRTGLGTHGLADCLAQLTIRYDSKEAIAFVDELYRTLRDSAYNKSIDLAIERGSFEVFDWEKEKDCKFIKRLPLDMRKRIEKYGRRNISLLTQAPTGSISIESKCGEFDSYNISAGVEPVFRNSYIRRKKINPSDKHVKVDFVDKLGDSWQEFKVYHGNVKNYMQKLNISGHDKLPDYFVTSDEIDWQRRVEIQSVEQQYIDHSISSTINLPRGTSAEVVGNIYLESWKKGLKGITVYVDGSRDGVLISNNAAPKGRPDSIMPIESPKRPESLPCEIFTVSVKKTPWTVIVGLMDEKPYELFMGTSDTIDLPRKYKEGKLIKVDKGLYNLVVGEGDDELIIKNVAKVFDNPEGEWATRMISMSLRHGVEPSYICTVLDKTGNLTDINKVIARVLKKYIEEGSKVKTSVTCTECSSNDLVYIEGCVTCQSCGWSKCG